MFILLVNVLQSELATSDSPGLGEVVGGVMGDDSPSGANNAWALISGKLSADAVANTLK